MGDSGRREARRGRQTAAGRRIRSRRDGVTSYNKEPGGTCWVLGGRDIAGELYLYALLVTTPRAAHNETNLLERLCLARPQLKTAGQQAHTHCCSKAVCSVASSRARVRLQQVCSQWVG
jgi:hypothetical protein